MKSWIVAAVLLGTLTAYSQKPAPPAQTPTQKVDPAKPAEIHVERSSGTASPAQVKELNDALSMYKLDQLAEQQAQQYVTTTDPVAKKAMEVLRSAVTSNPDVKKAHDQTELDLKALKDKIVAIRKAQGLDDSYDWDFNQNKYVQIPKPTGTPAK